jgi:hypothetical protein
MDAYKAWEKEQGKVRMGIQHSINLKQFGSTGLVMVLLVTVPVQGPAQALQSQQVDDLCGVGLISLFLVLLHASWYSWGVMVSGSQMALACEVAMVVSHCKDTAVMMSQCSPHVCPMPHQDVAPHVVKSFTKASEAFTLRKTYEEAVAPGKEAGGWQVVLVPTSMSYQAQCCVGCNANWDCIMGHQFCACHRQTWVDGNRQRIGVRTAACTGTHACVPSSC